MKGMKLYQIECSPKDSKTKLKSSFVLPTLKFIFLKEQIKIPHKILAPFSFMVH